MTGQLSLLRDAPVRQRGGCEIIPCLGHSNSAITARYIDHVDREEALDAMRDRVWLVAA